LFGLGLLARLARDEADQHLQLFVDRALVKDRPVQVHEGLGDGGPTRHSEEGVGNEPSRAGVVLEAILELRNLIAGKRLHVSHSNYLP